MRISDWSSDVCSSDLLESQPASRVQGGFCAVPWRPPRRSASRLRLRLQRGGRKDSWPAGRGERGPAWRPHRRRRPFEHHLARDQIGRAHVCTPVTNEQLVCRLLLEKKKDQITTRVTHTTLLRAIRLDIHIKS